MFNYNNKNNPLKTEVIGWHGSKKIETKYTVEFVTAKKDSCCFSCDTKVIPCGYSEEGEPLVQHTTKSTEDLGEAIAIFMCRLVNSTVLDVQICQQVFVDDEEERNAYITAPPTLLSSLCTHINGELLRENTDQQKRLDDLEKSNKRMLNFIKSYHAENSFKEYEDSISD